MSKGTTNVDQANFHVLSANPQKDGFEVEVAGKFPSNIDPEALREEFDKEGAISIALSGKAKSGNKGAKKQDDKDKGFEPGE